MNSTTTQLKEILSKGVNSILPQTVLTPATGEKVMLPNISKALQLCFAMAEELQTEGETVLAKRVLQEATWYVVSQSGMYYRDQYGYWETYKAKFREGSPCCCCAWQGHISTIAASMGFDDIAREAVSIQCPASPSGYRLKPSEGWGSFWDEQKDARCTHNTELIQAFLSGELDFLK